jgi:hypothetical protein
MHLGIFCNHYDSSRGNITVQITHDKTIKSLNILDLIDARTSRLGTAFLNC